MDLDNEKFYTVTETSNILKLKHNEIYKLIRTKELTAYRMGSNGKRNKYNRKPWRIREIDLLNFIERGINKNAI